MLTLDEGLVFKGWGDVCKSIGALFIGIAPFDVI
jgi:hypothetical protein